MDLSYIFVRYNIDDKEFKEYNKETGKSPIQFCLEKVKEKISENEEIINIQIDQYGILNLNKYENNIYSSSFNMIAYIRRKQ